MHRCAITRALDEFGERVVRQLLKIERVDLHELLMAIVDGFNGDLETRGIQLFSRMTGDHFAVLGLPLFELLEFLRSRGALLS